MTGRSTAAGLLRALQSGAVIGLLFCAPAVAEDDGIVAGRELMAVIGAQMNQDMVSTMLPVIWRNIETSLSGKVDLDDELRRELHAEIDPLVKEHITQAMEDLPAIYSHHFTAAEIRELTAFYKTPIGRKSVGELPKVTAEFSQGAFSAGMPALQAKIQAGISKVARQHALTKPAR